MEDVVVVTKDEKSKVKLHQAVNMSSGSPPEPAVGKHVSDDGLLRRGRGHLGARAHRIKVTDASVPTVQPELF